MPTCLKAQRLISCLRRNCKVNQPATRANAGGITLQGRTMKTKYEPTTTVELSSLMQWLILLNDVTVTDNPANDKLNMIADELAVVLQRAGVPEMNLLDGEAYVANLRAAHNAT